MNAETLSSSRTQRIDPLTTAVDRYLDADERDRPRAFAAVFEAAQPFVAAVVARHAPPVDVDDIVADVLLELATALPRFDSARGGIQTFIAAIARHRAIDALRRRKAERRALAARANGLPDAADYIDEAEAWVTDAEDLDQVDQLPRSERDVVLDLLDGQMPSTNAQRQAADRAKKRSKKKRIAA
ncbi:MAG: sigma-70 family RNA polymerase sigma factor [Planctomycetota bacterium]